MKRLSLFLVLIIMINCNSQEMRDKNLITDCINSVILKDPADVKEIIPYLNENTDISDDNELIKFQINLLKNQLLNQEFNILTYKEFKSKKEYRDYFIYYSELDKVYCLVANKKYITLFVVENNRITSFFTGIIKNKNRIIPYIL